jgi:hypothetical protein
MRKELEPNLVLAEKLYPLIFDLISEFDNACGNIDKQKVVIAKISQLTGKEIFEFDITEYWEYISKEDLTHQFAIPNPSKIEMSKLELIEILKLIFFAGDKLSNFYRALLELNFAHPAPTSISYSLDDDSIANAADIIFNYKPVSI